MTYTYRIVRDTNCDSPRNGYDNTWLWICSHKRYTMGDSHTIPMAQLAGWDEVEREIRRSYDVVIVKPLYMLDHSSCIVASKPFNDRFDSGQIGFAVLLRRTFKALYPRTSSRRPTKKLQAGLESLLEAEIVSYNQWLAGDVWRYEILDEAGACIDSCCGYYGQDNCTEAAQEVLNQLPCKENMDLLITKELLEDLNEAVDPDNPVLCLAGVAKFGDTYPTGYRVTEIDDIITLLNVGEFTLYDIAKVVSAMAFVMGEDAWGRYITTLEPLLFAELLHRRDFADSHCAAEWVDIRGCRCVARAGYCIISSCRLGGFPDWQTLEGIFMPVLEDFSKR